MGRTGTDFLLLGLAIAAPIASWLYSQYTSESHWFGRSGSVMVVIGIILESRLYIARQILVQKIDGSDNNPVANNHLAIRKISSFLTHLVLISGTFIWGYGDIIFSQLRLTMPD